MGFTNWRDALALLYTGLDRQTWICSNGAAATPNASNGTCPTGTTGPLNLTDCSATKRQTLINNWSNLFENSSCTNAVTTLGTCVGGGAATNPPPYCTVGATSGSGVCTVGTCTKYAGLTHAFRRDDLSGTSDILSNLIGAQGASFDKFGNKYGRFKVSSTAVNGFGTSPYCSAMNWDLTEAATAGKNVACNNSADEHYIGPGGVPVAASADSTQFHHVPPPSTYGVQPLGTQSVVLSTSFQDNDPLRTPCLGNGSAGRIGEDVCNNDGKLGVVLPIPALDFVAAQTAFPGLNGYTAAPASVSGCSTYTANPFDVDCGGGYIAGSAPQVFTCAPRNAGTKAALLCPNNDTPLGIGCFIPFGSATAGNTTQCQNPKSGLPTCQNPGQCGVDGRVYNEQVYNGVATDGSAGYLSLTFNEVWPTGATSGTPGTSYQVVVSHAGGYGRIHQREVSQLGQAVCHLDDATDNIGCLVQADPNAVGYGGNTGDTWQQREPLGQCISGAPTAGLPVHQIGAAATCVPAQPGGTVANYPIWRKLYFNSIVGFGNIPAANIDETDLAEYESGGNGANVGALMTEFGEFSLPFSPLGNQTVGGVSYGQPFCEDFNERAICSVTNANTDGCAGNSAVTGSLGTVPGSTGETLCGNGVIDDYEDCDTNSISGGAVVLPPSTGPNGACGSCSSACRCSLF
jgi:hypothetical protein